MKHKLFILPISSFLLVSFLANVNHPKTYQVDEYIPEENAYYGGPIEDESGHIKAHKFITPTDNEYSSQKTRSLGTSLIGDIESVWTSYTGKGTTIAVIDDGFDYNHPEYTRSDGTSAILNTSRYYYEYGESYRYKKYSDDPTCIAEDWESNDNGGYEWATHGTATSTTAAAPMNNGGGVGIAPEADILALKVDLSFAAIDGAIRYAVSQGVDVINISLGAYAESFTDGWGDSHSGYSSTATSLDTACQLAYDAGVIIVAAAGNESTWHKSYPACSPKVIGVGAIGDWDNKGNANSLAEFTNYVKSSQTGEVNVDILAPGYVYTAHQKGTESNISHTYDDIQGTSFSSPIVAGAACLWKQKYPNGTPDQFLSKLQSSADGIGYYTNKMIPISGWDSSLSDVGPSEITNGRLNVANLLDIDEPFVSTVQSSFNIVIGETRQITLDTYNGAITYSSSNTNVATVSNSGLIEAKSAGNATITVTATKNSHTATATIDVVVTSPVACSSISINPTSISVEAGKTYEIEPTISVVPSNATRSFMFASNNEGVATVDFESGLLTGVAVGSTTIDIESLYGSGSASLTVEVTPPSTPTSWDKITSTSELEDGDYLIVYESGSKAFDGGLETLDAVNNNISVEISNDSITYNSINGAAKFTINSISGGYSIKSASGYYIGRGANSNGIDTSTSEAYVNTISFTSGNATIVGSGGKTLCFNTQTGQNRFRYMSSGGLIQLYKATSSGSSSTTPVSSVSLSKSSLSLNVGEQETITATVLPNNATNKNVTWSSNNTGVATVSNGTITAVSAGNATITVTTVDGNKTATCQVTVTANKTLSSISISGQTTSFTVGDTFTFGGIVTAHYSDSSTANVTSSASFSGYNMSTAGNYTVTVSYTEGGVTKTASYQITVSSSGGSQSGDSYDAEMETGTNASAAVVSGHDAIKVGTSKNGGIMTITVGEGAISLSFYVAGWNNSNVTLSLSGATMNPSSIPLTSDSGISGNSPYTLSGSESTYLKTVSLSNITSETTITLSGNARFVVWGVTYEVASTPTSELSSITLDTTNVKKTFYIGEAFNYDGLVVIAHYEDESTRTVSPTSVSSPDMSTSGNKTITVTYNGKTATYQISVIVDTVTNVSVVNTHTYHPGDVISKGDITVTLTFESGKQETTTNFTFEDDGYMFTYSDAASGGASTSKQFSITYAANAYNFSVNVSRTAYQAIANNEVNISSAEFRNSTVSSSSGTPSSTSVTINNVGFTVTTNAYIFVTSNTYYLSFGKTAGSIKNATAFSGDLLSVSVTQKSTGRQDGALTISKDGTNWVNYSSSEIAKGGYRYFKYSYEGTSSASGAAAYSNIESIEYTIAGSDNPINVANYIMYEDTNNQCLTKLDIALNKLNTMSNADKESFWTSNDYVIKTARERLNAWALSQGKTLSFSNNTFTAGSNTLLFKDEHVSNFTTIILLVSLVLIPSGFIFISKKKKHI